MSTRLPGAKYKRIFTQGCTIRGCLFASKILRMPDANRQVGVIVSKKTFHDAVDRNRAKRILREAFRLLQNELPPDCDWILIGRSAIRAKKTVDVMAELRWACRKFLSGS